MAPSEVPARPEGPDAHERGQEQGGSSPDAQAPDLPRPDVPPELQSAIADPVSPERADRAVSADYQARKEARPLGESEQAGYPAGTTASELADGHPDVAGGPGTTGQPSESRPRPEFPGASPGHAADIATVAVADRGDEVPVQQELAAEAPVNPADTTDPVRSRKTWEGNPDSSELPQSMKEDLRELGKNLNEIVDPVDWANADIDSRKEMLDAANDRIRQEYGLPQRDVNYRSDLDPDDFGGYDPNTGDIEVNSRVLEDSDPEEAIKTLAHESFHDYQQQAIDGYPGDPYAQARASDWKEAGDNYDPDDAREYWTNQLEIDARAVEEEVYMGYRGV